MENTTATFTANSKPSMSDQLLKPIEEFQRLSQTLFLSLSSDQTARRVPPPSVSAFIECDAEISRALDIARMHQIKQQKVEALKRDILDLNAQWRHICSELEAGKQELEIMITEGDERIESIEKAKYGRLAFLFLFDVNSISEFSLFAISRTAYICSKSQLVHLRPTEYAGLDAPESTNTLVLPAIPQRRKDA
jgi:hypothetical protein